MLGWLVLAASLVAQSTTTVRIHVQHESMPVAGAEVVVNDKTYHDLRRRRRHRQRDVPAR